MMNRRAFVTGLGAVLAAPLAAAAQQPGTVYRIGHLAIGNSPYAYAAVFEQALRERGWATGKNLVVAYRNAEGNFDRRPAAGPRGRVGATRTARDRGGGDGDPHASAFLQRCGGPVPAGLPPATAGSLDLLLDQSESRPAHKPPC